MYLDSEIEGSIPVTDRHRKKRRRLLKANGKGSQIMLDLDGEQMDVLIKEIDYDTMENQR